MSDNANIINLGLSLNDVLMVPKLGILTTRKEANLETWLTNNIKLKIPIISSNMMDVTEDGMAIEMAKAGGIGILHRYCSIEEQVNMIKKVKQHMSYVIETPPTANWNELITLVNDRVFKKGHKSVLVVNDERKLVGIVTQRDLRFVDLKQTRPIYNLASKKLITAKKNVTRDEALKLLVLNKIEKLPIVDDNMHVVGLITYKDIEYYSQSENNATIDEQGKLMVGASIGVNGDFKERARQCIQAGADVIFVDVAHGHSEICGNTVKYLRDTYPQLEIVAGNVATPEGVEYLYDKGANAVKVSIGGGSICITREVTGCGMPQLSALLSCAKKARELNIPIISDGGNGGKIGNIAKSLGAGASCVMLGGFLAGTDESPGDVLVKDGKRVKLFRGMAGYGTNMAKRQRMNSGVNSTNNINNINNVNNVNDIVPEGVEGTKPYKGPVRDILNQIIGGIKSAISYNGVMCLEELSQNVTFVRVTSAGRQESNYHSIDKI